MAATQDMSSGQLAQLTFMRLNGYCRDWVRGRADTLLRSGQGMEAALRTAMVESMEWFPEVWLLIRAEDPQEWDVAEMRRLSVRVAEAAVNLRGDYIELLQSQLVDGMGLPEMVVEEVVLGGRGKGKGKGNAADFCPFSGKGHRLDDM